MYCGIDVGTQGVRAVIVDDAGAVVGEAAAPLVAGRRSGREHTQVPATWWDALVSSVRAAIADTEEKLGRLHDIDAIALDATSGTVLVQAADLTAVGDALMYDDSRAVIQAERVQQAGQVLWGSLGYRMQPSWALPKVLWLAEHAELSGGDRVVHQSDYLVSRLAGGPVSTDISNALKTGADLRAVTWPEQIHADLGLPVGLLPDLVVPGTVLASVGTSAATATGLRPGTPIRAGMTDGCAAQIAAGALETGSWSSALGTTLVIKGATVQLIRDPAGAVYCHRHPDGGWLPGGASSTGAGVLAQAFPGLGPEDLASLSRRAARLAQPDAVTYPLAGSGERFPFVAPGAHGFGLDEHADDATRFTTLCHGIAYVERLAYDILGTLGADVSGGVSLTGGGARNGWWNQLRTDLLGRPTAVPASSQAAFGMAVLAAAEPGMLTATAKAMVRIDSELTPDPERGEQLSEGYRQLVMALADRDWLDDGLATAVLALPAASR